MLSLLKKNTSSIISEEVVVQKHYSMPAKNNLMLYLKKKSCEKPTLSFSNQFGKQKKIKPKNRKHSSERIANCFF